MTDEKGVEKAPRVPPGIGVIHWRGRIVVYRASGRAIEWARPLGEECVEPDAELRSAIEADLAARLS